MPVEHNLVWTEQMMPVLPVVRVANIDDAIDLAVDEPSTGSATRRRSTRTNVDTSPGWPGSINVSIFIANGPNYAGLGEGGEGFTSFSIASPTGDGLTRPLTFTRERRIAVVGALRIV